MTLTDDFSGIMPSPILLTAVTAGGLGTTLPIQGILNATPPVRSYKTDKFTPISGTRAGKEQVLICSEESSECTLTLLYEKTHQAAMDALAGTNNMLFTLTFPDGFVFTATGGISKVGMARVEDSKHIDSDVTFVLNAGWQCIAGDVKTIVPAYVFPMVDAAGTIDLMACGADGTVNLTGKVVTKLTLTASATNGDPITVEVGETNGYEPVSGFSVVLLAGESETLEPLNAPEVGSGAKTLDVSGTGTQSVVVYIEAEDA